MKCIMITLAGLILSLPAYAQPDELYFDDDGYYDEYFDRDFDDVYKYGFRINNYVGPYADQFVVSLAREYGVPRSLLRSYIRDGFAPSDLLFGLELSARSGMSLRQVMDSYYRSPDRNWITISVNLGIGRASVGFRHILDRFRYQCGYWNNYYAHRNPHHMHPPVYTHSWSYFRPHTPHHVHRPQPPHRPPHIQPGPPPRPHPTPRPEPPHRPQPPDVDQSRPSGGSYRRETSSRPSSPSHSSQSSRPSRPNAGERPQDGNQTQHRRNGSGRSSSNRMENSGRETPSETGASRSSSGGSYRR